MMALVGVAALMLAGCGGNVSTGTQGTATAATVGNQGLLRPGSFQWGNDSTGGMPYIVPKDDNNKNGDYYGFEVDIANQIAKLMNVQSVPTQITWSDWPQGLAAQQFDVFMNGLEMTDENAKSAKFTIPYTVYTQSIVVKKDNTSINSFDDLGGKKVGTGTEYKAQFIMEDYNTAHPDKKINIQTNDTPTPFDDLAAGRVDAMFLDTPIAQWYGANDFDKRFTDRMNGRRKSMSDTTKAAATPEADGPTASARRRLASEQEQHSQRPQRHDHPSGVGH
jgi:polar amino acid transport system substrate-binding protein